ncbi:hypothetical protein [Caulobacter endophyticus]|uniref:hypothetical protein n=1 Tax=Caulobacter endophyticus TaxID=2172652 RepID=UPI00240FE63C|nr:hypothetical protein [Caulobacter endophyticus]MDG2528929.1 hypothetical protein [Caulobacter endophyticus]
MPWDKDLDRLRGIAAALGDKPAWRGFADYCAKRGAGLRPAAMTALEGFLDEAAGWTDDARLVFVRWLLPQSQGFMGQHLILPQPLHERVVTPAVRAWSVQAPHSAEPRLWLGLLRCDDPCAHLEAALALDPDCDLAKRTLVNWILADIDYNQHHMPAFYIHDPRRDLVDLDRVVALAGGGADGVWKADVLAEARSLRAVAERWLSDHPDEGDFASH